MKAEWFKSVLWGGSVALSWTWGLGLFFSVQFTHTFGLPGLLTFVIPNSLGLILFGLITQLIARRAQGSESLAHFFTNWSRPFRLIFFLYQILAISLTIFAIVRYYWQPLQLQPQTLYLPLTILIVLAAGCLFGEEFNIKRIKYSHGILFLIGLAAASYLLWTMGWLEDLSPNRFRQNVGEVVYDFNYWGYVVPLCIGLLLGPWLDLQQWQRAIQIQRENGSIFLSYLLGGAIFFLIIFFHGYLTLYLMRGVVGEEKIALIHTGVFDDLQYAQGMLTAFFFNMMDPQMEGATPWPFVAYTIFICICILTTLDSGYIALRWFLSSNWKTSKSALLSLIPSGLITSSVPSFIFAGTIAFVAVLIGLELEYFMIFYATFFVGYAALGICRCFMPTQGSALPQIKMFCVGSLAVVIFAYGYFLRLPMFQILGSLLPLGYVGWMLLKPGASSEFVTDTEELEAPATEAAMAAPRLKGPMMTAAVEAVGNVLESVEKKITSVVASPSGHFEGKWFVHAFTATYADTNSVGNVYFGMYAMWVGKTRELFFHQCLPHFNLKTTPYYILTRSFEHKYLRETREFEQVKVKIRVESFNRKFATLEHEIYDSSDHLLGKGKQTIMFVSSSDYKLIDIPQEVYEGFLPYT